MKIKDYFGTWEVGDNGLEFNTIIEKKESWEVIARYNAIGPIMKAEDNKGKWYVIIPLENGETATFNLEEYQIRTLMFWPIFQEEK